MSVLRLLGASAGQGEASMRGDGPTTRRDEITLFNRRYPLCELCQRPVWAPQVLPSDRVLQCVCVCVYVCVCVCVCVCECV